MKVVLKEGYKKSGKDISGTVFIRKCGAQHHVGWYDNRSVVIYNPIPGKGLIAKYRYEEGIDAPKIETYFQDWTHPTEQEAEMFHMLFGVEIPWVSIELEGE